MKAWLLKEFTGLDGLEMTADTPVPVPAEGEVLLRIRYAALNPADRYLAERLYPARPQLPHVLGRDACATVEKLGPGVDSVKAGDRVAMLRGDAGVEKWGTLAEFTAVPADVLVPAPEGWSDQEAAAAPLVYLTAYQALTQWGPLPGGSTVLVTGASGGVGLASLQLGSSMGFQMIGLSRDESKQATLEQCGAALVLKPDDADLRKKVKERAGKAGVALAVDNIGGTLLPRVIETLGQDGRVSLVGRLAGPVPEFNTATLFFRRNRLGGVSVGAYKAEEAQRAWQEILALLGKSGQRPLVDSTHPFENLKDAFKRLEGGVLGKVIVQVGA